MNRSGWREAACWAAALAIALLTTAAAVASPRAELVFRDADSLVVALFTRSLFEQDAVDWAMSPVLFLPEVAVFSIIWMVASLCRLTVDDALAVNAVVNLLAFYGALRLISVRRASLALLSFCAFAALVVTETSSSRDALELASLLLTTTYYSATVIGSLLAVGLVRRILIRPSFSRGLTTLLGALTVVSVLSNPLFGAWAVAPLCLILGVMVFSPALRGRALPALLALCAGSALGMAGRIPLSAWIANSGSGYAQPERWKESLSYYSGLVTDRLSSPQGLLEGTLIVVLLVYAAWRTMRVSVPGTRAVAAFALLSPLIAVVGGVALGTVAARYLAPLFFAPLLGLLAHDPAPSPRPPLRATAGAIAAALPLVAGLIAVPVIVGAAHRPDADLRCVTSWVDASGRTGAGQFWTVRLPKLHLADPARLVQVDHQLNGYAWLVNRADFDVGEVSFLVEDSMTVAWDLPEDIASAPRLSCGRWTIIDLAPLSLALGPQRS